MLSPVAVGAHLFEDGFDTSLSISKFFSIGEVEEVESLVDGDRWFLQLFICSMSCLYSYFLQNVSGFSKEQSF